MQPLEITHTTLNEWKTSGKIFTLIDIREEDERKESHMGGEWIPLSELVNRIDELPNTTIVFYCRSGGRSLMATKKLRESLERDNIYSLAGGMLALP